jgi:hypothetical protein
MQKKLIARTAKLLTETKKGRRKGVAVTYEHIPKDLEERNHGSLYAVIHVNSPVGEAQDVIELIIEAFHGEYYQDLGREPLLSFEAALSKINEELADITHHGNVSWLNNLDAILAVLTDNTLHITKSGKTEAYLYRGEKQSHISNDLAGDVVNPLRTFINIASGEMFEGDKIAIATPGTFFHLSKNELQKFVQGSQPKVAVSHIADILEGTAAEINPNAILIMEAITPEAASNETIEEEPDEVWISEPSKPIESAVKGFAPIAIKIFAFIKLGLIGIGAFTAEVLLPQAAKLIPALKTIADKASKRAAKSAENVLAETEESLSFDRNEGLDDLALKETSEVIGQEQVKKKANPNEFFIREDHKKLNWLNLEKVKFPRFGNVTTKGKRQFRKLAANPKRLAIVVLILAVVLAGGIFFAYKTNGNSKNVKVSEVTLNEAKSQFEAGKAALSEGDKLKAASLLREALASAESMVKDKKFGSEAKELVESIKTLLDEAEGVTRVNPEVFADATEVVGSNVLGPYLIGTSLFLINKDNGVIAEIGLKNGEVATVLENPETGKILAATAVTKRSVLVLATENELYEFDTKEDKLSKQDLQGDLEKIVGMTSFSTNIYSVDGTGKIYKRLKTSTGYAKRSLYITDNTDVSGSGSIATDSAMYALAGNGAIAKYLSGKTQSFSVEYPFKLQQAASLFTTEDLGKLFFTDSSASRVIALSTDGKFEKQYVSDSFSNLKGVTASGNTIYVMSGGKIYKLLK